MQLAEKHQDLFAVVRNNIEQAQSLFRKAQQVGVDSQFDFTTLFDQLDQPFSIFICGEFNSGKSSLLNAIEGGEKARIGVLPTTSSIELIASESLRGLSFVDSPGTNSILENHQDLTESFLQRADVVLFVTSVERPLSDSELKFLEKIKERWLRKVFVVINKIDLIDSAQLEEVKNFVKRGLAKRFAGEVPIYPLSTRNTQGISELRSALLEILNKDEQIKIKLSAPQQSVLAVLSDLDEKILRIRSDLDHEKKLYNKVIRRCESRIAESDLFLGAFGDRIVQIFSELANQLKVLIDRRFGLFTLLKSKVFKRDAELKAQIYEILDSIDLENKLNSILDHAAETVCSYQAKVISEAEEDLELASSFSSQKIQVPVIEKSPVDASAVAGELRASSEKTIKKFLALGSAAAVSGVGATVATTATFEISGLILMFALGAFGLRVVPAERDKAKQAIDKSFSDLGSSFAESLDKKMKEQMSEGLQRLKAGFAPQLDQISSKSDEIESIMAGAQTLRKTIRQSLDDISQL